MWARISKTVDMAMAAEDPREIKQQQIEHVLQTIMVCVLPKIQVENPESSLINLSPSAQTATATTFDIQISAVSFPSKSHSWANVAAQNAPHTKSLTKLCLAKSL